MRKSLQDFAISELLTVQLKYNHFTYVTQQQYSLPSYTVFVTLSQVYHYKINQKQRCRKPHIVTSTTKNSPSIRDFLFSKHFTEYKNFPRLSLGSRHLFTLFVKLFVSKGILFPRELLKARRITHYINMAPSSNLLPVKTILNNVPTYVLDLRKTVTMEKR